ncbi:hypothetical protein K1T71_001461 [Dendrolimus kikuchii]|uniref:Uncharacterized protein n=1 Tax=Dendrolimus kikuchii TaxID=765133 RepID=A0ACC1DI06_9NEOP|nr:hypothetical protein K1T71_001461 [Dendrolimus kikuchii]
MAIILSSGILNGIASTLPSVDVVRHFWQGVVRGRDFSGPHLAADCHIWHGSSLNTALALPTAPPQSAAPQPLHFRLYYFYLRNKLKIKALFSYGFRAPQRSQFPANIAFPTDVSGYVRAQYFRSARTRALAVGASEPYTDGGARDGAARSQSRSERPSRQSRPRSFRVFGQSPFVVRTVKCVKRVCAPVTVAYCEVIMDAPGGAREPRFGSPYGMGLLSEMPDMYGGRPPSGLSGGGGLRPGMQPCPMPRAGVKRPSDQCYDERPSQSVPLEHCTMPDIADDYASLQPKKSPPSNGKKTKGRVKIKMEYIDNKLRRYTTFSKRKTGIMKKAYELSTLTGTQVMLLVASETGHVYTFATRKLQPMITSDSGKRLIQTCLNSPDPPTTSEQRMAATGFEETELTYNVVDEDMKDEPASSGESGDESGSEPESPCEKLMHVPKQEWTNKDNIEREIKRDPHTEPYASTSSTTQEADSSKSSQPNLQKALPKLNLPGGAMLYHSSVLAGLDGISNNIGLGSLAMSYPHSLILGLANQGQEGATSSAQPQFITIPLSMAMAGNAGPSTTNGCPVSASSDDSSELQDLSTGRK